MNNLQETDKNLISQFYTPTELLCIFENMLIEQNKIKKVIWMRGIYLLGNSLNNNYCKLKDEVSNEEITISISAELKQKVSNGNIVMIAGVVDRKVWSNGNFQISLKVTRIDVVQEQTISETELKQAKFRNIKVKRGFCNVDSLLENKLYTENRPRIALLYADSSITDKDFIAGKEAASSHIDMEEFRVSFANPVQFSDQLKQLDKGSYDTIAIIRGGGSGLEAVDNLLVLEVIVNMITPIICAVGHDNDKVFLKNVADKVVPVPHALGTYFRDMVERVITEKSNSRAVLAEQVKKQYVEQLQIQEKQNAELQKQLKVITEANKNSSTEAAKQMLALQRQLKEITDANNDKDKVAQKQISSLSDQIKKLTEDRANQDKVAAKQIEALNNQIMASRMQQDRLMASIKEKDDQIRVLANKRSGCFGMAAIIIGIILLIGNLLF